MLGDPVCGDPSYCDPVCGDPSYCDPVCGDPSYCDPACRDPACGGSTLGNLALANGAQC